MDFRDAGADSPAITGGPARSRSRWTGSVARVTTPSSHDSTVRNSGRPFTPSQSRPSPTGLVPVQRG